MKKFFLATISLFAVFVSYASAQTPTSTLSIKVPILIYHSVRPYYPGITKLVKEFTVPPDVFEDQLKYLHDNGFTPITPDDLTNYLTSGKSLPQKPFMITLDDGWRNQFNYAFPVLKKYNDHAVFYIYSDVIGKKHFLTWDEVKNMANANMIIGGHTKSHPELSKIVDDNALRQEIVGSKKIIEDHLGKTLNDFAYPFGKYNDHVVSMVAQAGYKSARTVVGGNYQSKEALLTLHGIIITGDFNRFVALINK